MSISEVQLQPEKILEHARDVIKPGGWYCEWNPNTGPAQKPTMCRIMLSSWNAYLKVCKFCPIFSTILGIFWYFLVKHTRHYASAGITKCLTAPVSVQTQFVYP